MVAPEGQQPACHARAHRPRSAGAQLCPRSSPESAELLLPSGSGSEERSPGSPPRAGIAGALSGAAVRTCSLHYGCLRGLPEVPPTRGHPQSPCFIPGDAKARGLSAPQPRPPMGLGAAPQLCAPSAAPSAPTQPPPPLSRVGESTASPLRLPVPTDSSARPSAGVTSVTPARGAPSVPRPLSLIHI